MDSDPQTIAKGIVHEYLLKKLEKTDDTHVAEGDIYVVWFCYILGGWKVLISTTLPDGMYYEVTHNRLEDETYVDVYKKWDNFVVQPEYKN